MPTKAKQTEAVELAETDTGTDALEVEAEASDAAAVEDGTAEVQETPPTHYTVQGPDGNLAPIDPPNPPDPEETERRPDGLCAHCFPDGAAGDAEHVGCAHGMWTRKGEKFVASKG